MMKKILCSFILCAAVGYGSEAFSIEQAADEVLPEKARVAVWSSWPEKSSEYVENVTQLKIDKIEGELLNLTMPNLKELDFNVSGFVGPLDLRFCPKIREIIPEGTDESGWEGFAFHFPAHQDITITFVREGLSASISPTAEETNEGSMWVKHCHVAKAWNELMYVVEKS